MFACGVRVYGWVYVKGWGPWNVCSKGPTIEGCCGGVLLSHTLPGAVPSALAGLASRFGMEAGRFPAAMTTTRWFNQYFTLLSPESICFGGCVGCDPHSGDEHPLDVCQPYGVYVCG